MVLERPPIVMMSYLNQVLQYLASEVFLLLCWPYWGEAVSR